ncbi:MAG: hypothetical protein CME33_25890, partial [Gimesia sp.]|nr:hypothetical protein [Gimesia sp.]
TVRYITITYEVSGLHAAGPIQGKPLEPGSPGCNPGLPQATGNCQSKRIIQNNKANPFIVGVDPCVDPPGKYQPGIAANGNR